MASRYELELKLSSARNLKNVNWRYGPNRPYAVVWVDPNNKCSSRVDESGDTDAEWDQTLMIPLPPQPLQDLTLYIDVVHAGSEEDIKPLIGTARLSLSDVLNDGGIGERISKTLTLKRPSGRPHGKIDFKVIIRDTGYRGQGGYYAPPYGVAPPPPAGSRDYAPPSGYGYQYGAPPPVQGSGSYYSQPPTGYPSQPPTGYPYGGGYGAPPPAVQGGYSGGYEAPPVVVEEKKKSKFGGMGTGLAVGALAGAVGGIALFEGAEYLENKIADKAADKVEEDLVDDGYGDDDF